ncbi:Fatty acid hydroxylase [Penicillium digitatum]|uniref:Uncharacterized protein n=3 Tax=Penicillium digitatum TaxID=36651 RepID=K9FRD8_PEND2|nr:hypothetical protein PDIP_49620 [Penicillium digitatum Pd1]EKV10952.1 hypothetical protein PDIG_54400 [Penicillium digitatum PHI26]EKV13274.1 hypothetical protein PDIP_49620 [Penicillium digitatum Pd1]KAG0155726.1 hypothetical protein PDIDSM_2899 [Penicillium digitatum]QQK43476.1 Fatty acid hydroxylase [Penicillium digitatum]
MDFLPSALRTTRHTAPPLKPSTSRKKHALRWLGHQHGFLDGDKHARDGVPDVGVAKVIRSLMSASTMFTVFIAYHTTHPLLTITFLSLSLEAGLFYIIFEFWFYW